MNQFAKIVDHKHLFRDMYSKAILNTDISVVKKHEKRMRDLQKEDARDKEFQLLKNEMIEIKKMLSMLTTKQIEV
jgi:hypothetical protein